MSDLQRKKVLKILVVSIFFGFIFLGWQNISGESRTTLPSFSEQEAGFETEPDSYVGFNGKYSVSELENWQRPDGPARVGIQSGHWKVEEVPEELEGLKRNGAGAVGGGTNERDTVLTISNLVVELLGEEGVEAEVLPVSVPPGYIADAFVSIHADGNPNSSVSGFKIAGPRRDYSGRSDLLEKYLYESYGEATELREDPNITWGMRGYYAFNWRRYDHAIHPMTPAVIVETGFLTNPNDRQIIVNSPEISARGIAEGVLRFLEAEGLL